MVLEMLTSKIISRYCYKRHSENDNSPKYPSTIYEGSRTYACPWDNEHRTKIFLTSGISSFFKHDVSAAVCNTQALYI